MINNRPRLFEGKNLSIAWGRVFLSAMQQPRSNPAPMVVSILGFEDGAPIEDCRIRNSLDELLAVQGKNSCNTSAMIVFPYRQWIRQGRPPCEAFSKWCVERFLPRLKRRDQRNRKGLYFERMMDYRGAGAEPAHGKNQLLHIIEWWNELTAHHHRRPPHSRMQVACFDPFIDHNHECRPYFPCLQQVSFCYDSEGGLTVNAFYPTQYLFDRAYGNYLGLCHLGSFMARELHLTLVRFNCFVGRAEIGGATKGELQSLMELVEAVVKEKQE
jgi:hypothetical protein